MSYQPFSRADRNRWRRNETPRRALYLFTMARARYLATLDNSLRASCSDWLIERNPELAAVIKRRARKRTAAKAVAPCQACRVRRAAYNADYRARRAA